jgi:hypothetical protein
MVDVDQKRLIFRRLRVGIANVRRQGVSDIAFASHAFKTPESAASAALFAR